MARVPTEQVTKLEQSPRRVAAGTILVVALLGACDSGSSTAQSPAYRPRIMIEVDGTTASITGTGFDPSTYTAAVICDSDATTGAEGIVHCNLIDEVQIGMESNFKMEIQVPMVTAVGMRFEISCAAPDSCTVGIVNWEDEDGTVLASTPVSLWDAEPARPAPRLTLSRVQFSDETATAMAMVSGTVDVVGAGFLPLERVSLVQCPRGETERSVAAEFCRYREGVLAQADEDGSFAVAMPLARVLEGPDDSLLDCLATPDECVVSAPWPEVSAQRMAVAALSHLTDE